MIKYSKSQRGVWFVAHSLHPDELKTYKYIYAVDAISFLKAELDSYRQVNKRRTPRQDADVERSHWVAPIPIPMKRVPRGAIK